MASPSAAVSDRRALRDGGRNSGDRVDHRGARDPDYLISCSSDREAFESLSRRYGFVERPLPFETALWPSQDGEPPLPGLLLFDKRCRGFLPRGPFHSDFRILPDSATPFRRVESLFGFRPGPDGSGLN